MGDEFADDAVLSDVDGEEEPVTGVPSSISSAEHRLRDLVAELDQERRVRKAAEDFRAELQTSVNRLKAFAQDVIKKRDEALREKEESVRSTERARAELSEAVRQKEEALQQEDKALKKKDEALEQMEEALKQRDEALKQMEEALRQKEEAFRLKESSRAEIETATQMMVTGIEKISSKISGFKNFSVGALPRSHKYTGPSAVAYGVIKRANEIAEELAAQIDAAVKARDEAREQIEQRNYEIAIEVSQLEATISGLREETIKKGSEIELLGKMCEERDVLISEMEKDISRLKHAEEDSFTKLRNLEVKVDAQRPLIIDQLKHISQAYEQINGIIRTADECLLNQSESDSSFMWKEMDNNQNLRTSLEGTASICELAIVAFEKVRLRMEKRNLQVRELEEKVAALLEEKQQIGNLLRNTLSSKTNKVLQVAEEGLRVFEIESNINCYDKNCTHGEEDFEVTTLAGTLENIVKTSQIEIIKLKHMVEALRAESSLLKAHLDAQTKEIGQLMHQIKELEEKEHMSNESVECLMIDIAAAEEEIGRWKLAAEQEAAAGKAIEQEFAVQLSSLQDELQDAKHIAIELEKKLKFKEETAVAAIAAKNAAEISLRLADVRAGRLRERAEEMARQLEQFDKSDTRNQTSHRYVCWPWQWLGLDSVRYNQAIVQESSNEMELSEPLI